MVKKGKGTVVPAVAHIKAAISCLSQFTSFSTVTLHMLKHFNPTGLCVVLVIQSSAGMGNSESTADKRRVIVFSL